MPLDRENTSYRAFPPCRECIGEYEDPENRRFHAQMIACQTCGPDYFLLDREGKKQKNPVKTAIQKLKKGDILAIKGVGGIHLACRAEDDSSVRELRKRRNRPQQPFAVMTPLDKARRIACISKKEERLLCSRERPIVLLQKGPCYDLSEQVAPGLGNIGIMLPYTGLHHIIFKEIDGALVMTSANRSGEPMIKDNREILKSESADYYLLHSLDIVNRCDDSVLKQVNNRPVFIRRSRGYVPKPVHLANPEDKNIIALGAEENVSFCLLKGGDAYMSQHIGNTENLRTMEFLRKAIDRFLEIFPSHIDAIACDLHPSFNTSGLAVELSEEYSAPITKVQHHHAHLMSLAGEHRLSEFAGICCDGTGYGIDGKAWGGEVFSLRNGKITRIGHLKEQPMAGGDLAAHYPARMAAGILYGEYDKLELEKILSGLCFPNGRKEISVILAQLDKKINVQQTTSTGRVLDAVSALLGVCARRTYEGEPAMKLEAAGAGGKDLRFQTKTEKGILDTSALLKEALEAKKAIQQQTSHTQQKPHSQGGLQTSHWTPPKRQA